MKWEAATEMTGFAFRDLANGKVSIRSRSGRQWTFHVHNDDTYLDEIPLRYHGHSINKVDWRVLESGTDEYEFVVGRYGKPYKTGFRETLIRANDLKDKIGITGKIIGDVKLTAEDLDHLLTDMISYATELKNLL